MEGSLTILTIRSRDILANKNTDILLLSLKLISTHFVNLDPIELLLEMASSRSQLMICSLILKSRHGKFLLIGACLIEIIRPSNQVFLEYLVIHEQYWGCGFGMYMVTIIKDLSNFCRCHYLIVSANSGTENFWMKKCGFLPLSKLQF